MERLHFSIDIDAPKDKVWNTMLGEDTYRIWTEAFAPGSHYKGDWSEGSKMLFLAPDDSGKNSGMLSRVKENRKFEYLSIEHLGIVQDEEDTSSNEVKEWAGAIESYTLRENNGQTEVLIEMDTEEEYKEMFRDMWPKALQKLKELSETDHS